MKRWRRSKAMWLATVAEILGGAQLMVEGFREHLPWWFAPASLICIGVAIRIVRLHTSEPLEPPPRRKGGESVG